MLVVIALFLAIFESGTCFTPRRIVRHRRYDERPTARHPGRGFLQLLATDEESDGWDSEFPVSASNSDEEPRAIAATRESSDERDLFVPILALVSITGLFGAYAYETVRLYQAGELYLPFFNSN